MSTPGGKKIIVSGCLGRLGSAICDSILQKAPRLQLAAGVDVIEPTQKPLKYDFFTDVEKTPTADALIICLRSSAEAEIISHLAHCAAKKMPVLVCTTAFSAAVQAEIDKTAKICPVLVSANLSLGVNLLATFLEKYAHFLHESGFDIEIVERHHNQKLDAPSGTAFLLADASNHGFDNPLTYTTDRSQTKRERPTHEIGIHAIRGGTITGEHTVIFAGQDEVIELSHSARSRTIFAEGAVKAVEFLCARPPGLYSMQDVFS
jgi:4-hydroxy-tetrahydrodipicolinate reductase